MSIKDITVHIYTRTGQYDKPGNVQVFSHDMRDNPSCMQDMRWLCEHTFQADLPEFDMTTAQIEAVNQQIEEERATFNKRIEYLTNKLNILQSKGATHEND